MDLMYVMVAMIVIDAMQWLALMAAILAIHKLRTQLNRRIDVLEDTVLDVR